MPSEAIARQAAMIREFIAFVYGLILLIPTLPRRIAAKARLRNFLNPRLQSASWKLAMPRPPSVQVQGPIPGFDQWKAHSRYDSHETFNEAPWYQGIREGAVIEYSSCMAFTDFLSNVSGIRECYHCFWKVIAY